MGWSLYQVWPIWIDPKYDRIFPKCDRIFPNIAGFHQMDSLLSSFIFQMGPAQPGLLV